VVVWSLFIACTAVILFTGTLLSKYGDILAEKSGLGRTLIGVILMASVTSLPELITGISSIIIFDLPNIAAGDVIGSCMFNLVILALLDLVDLGNPLPLPARAHQGHVLSAGFGILLLGLVVMGVVAGERLPRIAWIGVYSVVFIAVYMVAMRMIFLHEKNRISRFIEEMAEELQYQHISGARALAMYVLNAVVLIGAATYLPHLGEQIAELTGLGQTFVGNILIALSTSLPEVAVSVAAVRIGAIDMAVGNLFGSNLFNIAVLALDDILYVKGPLLLWISSNHIIAAISAICMTAIAIIGLTYRTTNKKPLFFSWDSLGILGIYGVAVFLLYTAR
jgi:cation:H+ antiporter